MTIDQICRMTNKPEVLNALHACRPGHPLNNSNQWRNAHFLAAHQPSYVIPDDAVAWLAERATAEHVHANT